MKLTDTLYYFVPVLIGPLCTHHTIRTQAPSIFLVGPFSLPNQSTAVSSACRLSADRDLTGCWAC